MNKISPNKRRRFRNRKKLKNRNSSRLRLSVFRSIKNISAQIIDDKNVKTLVSASSNEKDLKKNKLKKAELSNLIGEVLAKRKKKKNISNVYFDRGEYKYHGRIKILAESLRKNGLKF